MSSSTIKIPVQTAISLLKDRKKELEKKIAEYPKLKAQHEKELVEWEKKLAQAAIKSKNITQVSTHRSYYRGKWSPNGQVTLTYQLNVNDIPPEPQFDAVEMTQITLPNGNTIKVEAALREVTNTLKMLELTDQTHVPASMYRSISQYL